MGDADNGETDSLIGPDEGYRHVDSHLVNGLQLNGGQAIQVALNQSHPRSESQRRGRSQPQFDAEGGGTERGISAEVGGCSVAVEVVDSYVGTITAGLENNYSVSTYPVVTIANNLDRLGFHQKTQRSVSSIKEDEVVP